MLPQQQCPQLWHLRKQQAGLLVEGNEIDEPEMVEDLDQQDLGEGLKFHRFWVTCMGQAGRIMGNSGCGYLCSLSMWSRHLLANSPIIGLTNHSPAGTSEDQLPPSSAPSPHRSWCPVEKEQAKEKEQKPRGLNIYPQGLLCDTINWQIKICPQSQLTSSLWD